MGGHRRALERVRVTERDLGRLDQAIAAGIGKRVRGTPVAACRVPDLVALRGAPKPEDDRGPDGVRLEHAIPVPPRAGGDVPLDVRVPHQLSGQEQLIAFVADLAEVVQPREALTDRRRDLHRDEPVLRILVVIRPFEVDASIDQVDVEPGLELARLLGLQLGVARPADRDRRHVAAVQGDRDRVVEMEGVERARGAARLAPRGPDPQAVQPTHAREERLLRDHPRAGQLRVENVAEFCAEGRILVRPHRSRQIEPIADSDHLLDVGAEGHEGRRRVADRGHDHSAESAGAGDDLPPRRLHLLKGVLEVLHAEGRVGSDHRRHAERRPGGERGGVGEGLGPVGVGVAVEAVLVERDHARRRELIVALVRHVVADRSEHGQVARGPEVDVQASGEPLDILSRRDLERLLWREEPVPSLLRRKRGI